MTTNETASNSDSTARPPRFSAGGAKRASRGRMVVRQNARHRGKCDGLAGAGATAPGTNLDARREPRSEDLNFGGARLLASRFFHSQHGSRGRSPHQFKHTRAQFNSAEFSPSPRRGEGRDEEAKTIDQIPSPKPSHRLGGAREKTCCGGSFIFRPNIRRE